MPSAYDLELLGQIDAALEPEPLTVPEQVLGYSRSILSGPTFNYNDEIEALAASLFTDQTYKQELEGIRSQHKRFKDQTDYIDNAVEIGSGLILNPLDKLKKVKDMGSGILNAAKTLGTSAPAQAAIATTGMTEGNENLVRDALTGALVGSAFSAGSSVVGKGLEKAGLNSNRLKLSSYGVGVADINKELKGLGKEGVAKLTDDIPIAKSIKEFEELGVINAGDDVLQNLKSVVSRQRGLSTNIAETLAVVDEVLPPSKTFQTDITDKYIQSLTGTAREKAEDAAIREYLALTKQIGTGTLRELQDAKIGLNYKYDKNPYAEDIIKTMQSDLRQEIENRTNTAARNGLVSESIDGAVKELNREWGALAELGDVFVKGVGKKYGGDVVEDVIYGGATTGGVGTLNQMSASTGNIIPAVAGALLSAARVPESKSAIADVLSSQEGRLVAAGRALPELVTGRSSVQAVKPQDLNQGQQRKKKESKSQTNDTERIRSLLKTLDELGVSSENQPRSPQQQTESTTSKESRLYKGESLENQSQIANPSIQNSATSIPNQPTNNSVMNDLFSRGNMEAKQPVAMVDQDVEPLIQAVIEQESGGNPRAVSEAGAVGLMQIMPATAREIAQELGVEQYDLTDPETNRTFGSYYLKKLLQQFGGDPELALTAYHSGPGRVERLLKLTGGSRLEDIIDLLGPVGQRYARQTLARLA